MSEKAEIIEFTWEQKVHAMSMKYYLGGLDWSPKIGDYFTICRADLELFKIVSETETQFGFIEVTGTLVYDKPDMWDKDGFESKNFGVNYVWVHPSVLQMNSTQQNNQKSEG